MSLFSMSIRFIRKAAAFLLLPLLACSCQWMEGDYDGEGMDINANTKYINITISVSASSSPVTRAPLGGEYGDGTEKGIETRENEVKDITLIFYQDANGINTTSDDAEVLCVKKYDVHVVRDGDLPSNYAHSHKTGETSESSTAINQEVIYTTGNQKLNETSLEAGETYRVLVVANAVVNVKEGDKIKDVREKVLSKIYTGTGLGIDATDFVMTSESDATVTLTNPTVDTSTGEPSFVYYFNCIHMERLAARIDYCTSGATYSDTYTHHGYKYNVGTTDNEAFYIVTKVTPFNLYTENEYLFKRVRNNWIDPTPVISYLGDESTSNYVVDPKTAYKVNTVEAINSIGYSSRLNTLLPAGTNSYTQVMEDVHSTSSITANGYNNIIIAYPRENTLNPTSLLKNYATGIAFEVYYYPPVHYGSNGNPGPRNPKRTVYYHYLRHQGEPLEGTQSYVAKKLEGPIVEQDRETCGNVPMRCGIVRNNIYRVSIHSFNPENGTITLTVEEEKWRHVDNPVIYI